ncbi:MAG: hypothetical protein AAGK09_05900 [Planctomycetota bacterium]
MDVAWRLMFRVGNQAKAQRCLDQALEVVPGECVAAPQAYWKIPELWESSIQSAIEGSSAAAVLHLLQVADRLGTGWNVTGPTIHEDMVTCFEGIFDVKSHGRPHIAGLEWAWFSVGDFSGQDAPARDSNAAD